MSGRTYEDGRRNAIRACVRWLHERASQMNDPHAKAVLNSAAFALGTDKPNPIKRLRMLTENTNVKLTDAQRRALKKVAKRDCPAGEPRLDWLNSATAQALLSRNLITERPGTAGHPFPWSKAIVDLTDAGRAALEQN